GFRDNVDINKVINFDLSIKEGAINVFSSATSVYYPSLIECVCKTFGIDMNTPFKELSQEDQDIIFNGNREKEVIHKYINMEGLNKTRVNYFEGVRDIVYRRYTSSMSKSTREAMSKYIKEDICKSCKGKRLRPEILSIYVGNENIADIVAKSIRD
ncbi:excinuclease ABC subunit A, partial [Streptococcus danieliae]|nr:excinuclease ABC subunit A [Streptococcus danieliae]